MPGHMLWMGMPCSEDRVCTPAVSSKPETGCTEGIRDSSLESRENQHLVAKWESHFETAPVGSSLHGHRDRQGTS